jgi:hypothetical protein
MGKTTRRLATAAATLAVAGGIAFTTGGAASAATVSATSAHTMSQSTTTADRRPATNSRHWDGHQWWDRNGSHGDWYSNDHGHRFRFDGHRFYEWFHGRWKPQSNAYARHHGFKQWK